MWWSKRRREESTRGRKLASNRPPISHLTPKFRSCSLPLPPAHAYSQDVIHDSNKSHKTPHPTNSPPHPTRLHFLTSPIFRIRTRFRFHFFPILLLHIYRGRPLRLRSTRSTSSTTHSRAQRRCRPPVHPRPPHHAGRKARPFPFPSEWDVVHSYAYDFYSTYAACTSCTGCGGTFVEDRIEEEGD